MCKFCESLLDETKEIIWSVRSTYADDNICEFVNDEDCSNCSDCKMYFNLDGYEYKGNTSVNVTYNQTVTTKDKKQVIIRPFSEGIQFNYCPICGKQMSKTVKDFDDYYSHQIDIYDKEV